MITKYLFSIVFFILGISIFWNFTTPFKEQILTPLQAEATNMQQGYEQARKQLTLDTLRQKRNTLTQQQLNLLKNYIPEEVNSNRLTFNLLNSARQYNLSIKNIKYSISDLSNSKDNKEKDNSIKKITIDFQIDGNYSDFINWITLIESADVLIDTESVKGILNNNISGKINWSIKMVAYGKNIL